MKNQERQCQLILTAIFTSLCKSKKLQLHYRYNKCRFLQVYMLYSRTARIPSEISSNVWLVDSFSVITGFWNIYIGFILHGRYRYIFLKYVKLHTFSDLSKSYIFLCDTYKYTYLFIEITCWAISRHGFLSQIGFRFFLFIIHRWF